MKVSPFTSATEHTPQVNLIRGSQIVPARKAGAAQMPAPPARHSRLAILKGASAGVAAASLIGLSSMSAYAQSMSNDEFLKAVFNILATGEKLNVVFYQLGVANHDRLGFHGDQLLSLKAILIEEQIHNNAAEAHGGVAATTHFSFPLGAATFTDRVNFLTTMKQIEETTNSALLALIHDCAERGLTQYARLAGQLLAVEGGHRVVGRMLLGMHPVEDWAFGPALLARFLDVPDAVTKAGFLSPVAGNDYPYQPMSASLPGVSYTAPVTA